MNRSTEHTEGAGQPAHAFTSEWMLLGMNAPVCAAFLINRPEFIIGKDESCDGRLTFSDEISRKHAKILWRDGAYFLVDLDSLNKTFLNGVMLEPHQETALEPGDIIGFSTSLFSVEKINR